jgi:hypothetical protein
MAPSRLSLGVLVSCRWTTVGAFFRDFALAVGFMAVVIPLVAGLVYLLGGANASIANITPKPGSSSRYGWEWQLQPPFVKNWSSVDISFDSSTRGREGRHSP